MSMISNPRFHKRINSWPSKSSWRSQIAPTLPSKTGWWKRVSTSKLKESYRRQVRTNKNWMKIHIDLLSEKAQRGLQLQKVSHWFQEWMTGNNCLNGIYCTWNREKTCKKETKMTMKSNLCEQRKNTLSNLIRAMEGMQAQAFSIGLNHPPWAPHSKRIVLDLRVICSQNQHWTKEERDFLQHLHQKWRATIQDIVNILKTRIKPSRLVWI